MLSDKEVFALKEELLSCQNPLFLFDDDPDGFASFLLFYRFVREGRGLVVKQRPSIGIEPFARKVEELGADKVFILDVANVGQEFLDAVKVPVVWVDHHGPVSRDRVKYFNPRKTVDKNVPASALCWQVVCDDRPEDLWIAVAGSVGDWFMPPFADTLKSAAPTILPHTGDVADILYNSKMGVLVKIMSFNLKGPSAEVAKSIKIFTRIEDPFEILNQSSSRGKFLWKRYECGNKVYADLLAKALKQKPVHGVFVFTYTSNTMSVTKDLSNELLYRLNCVVIVAREKQGSMRCSLRSPQNVELSKAVAAALKGVEGYGGGHEHACGANISKEDFDRFVKNLRKELKLSL